MPLCSGALQEKLPFQAGRTLLSQAVWGQACEEAGAQAGSYTTCKPPLLCGTNETGEGTRLSEHRSLQQQLAVLSCLSMQRKRSARQYASFLNLDYDVQHIAKTPAHARVVSVTHVTNIFNADILHKFLSSACDYRALSRLQNQLLYYFRGTRWPFFVLNGHR